MRNDEYTTDPEESFSMHRRRLLQLAVSGTALSGIGTTIGKAESTDSFVDILSADPSAYPTIGLSVRVDSDAGRDGRLTKDDFTVYEGGEKRTVTDFEFSSSTLDIVFVFDDSGSMGGEIATMQRETKGLTEMIASSNIDARYGLVSFRDAAERDLGLTDDADELKTAVDSLLAYGGGDFPEDNFDAIETALGFDFRDDAQKVIVDITDATSHYQGDSSGLSQYTLSEVAADLKEQGVLFIGVSPGYDDPKASLKILSQEANGIWLDIHEADFDQILQQIVKLVVKTYILKYETDTLPGNVGEIGVAVDDPNLGVERAVAEVSVPEGAGPTIPLQFRRLRDAKIELAGHIDDISQSISEQDRITEVLGGLETDIENGAVDANEAIAAVKRMILGEDLTELSLAGISPVSVSSPADSTSLVGEASGSPGADDGFDIAGSFVKNAGLLVAGLTLALRGFSSVVSWLSKFTTRAREAMNFLDTAISAVFGAIPFIDERLEDAADYLNIELEDAIEDGVTEANELYESAAGTVEAEIQDPLSEFLLRGFENGFESKLESFDTALGVDDGEFTFEGSDGDAADAATNARMEIISELKETKDELEVTGFVAGVGSLMAVGGALLSLTGFLAPLGVALTIVGSFFSLGFSFLGSVSAADGLFSVREHHHDGLDSIVLGGA